MWNIVIELFRNYMGTGLILTWFLICLVYTDYILMKG